jgi:hypothetical protein
MCCLMSIAVSGRVDGNHIIAVAVVAVLLKVLAVGPTHLTGAPPRTVLKCAHLYRINLKRFNSVLCQVDSFHIFLFSDPSLKGYGKMPRFAIKCTIGPH